MRCSAFDREGERTWGVVHEYSAFKDLHAKLAALGERQAPTSDSVPLFEALAALSFPAAGWERVGLTEWVNGALQALIWHGAALPADVGSPKTAAKLEGTVRASVAVSLELVLLRVTAASEEKADHLDIATIREFTTTQST